MGKTLKLLGKNKLALCLDDSTIRIWDLKNDYNRVKVIKGQTDNNTCLLLVDGKLISGSDDILIRIWDCNDNYK